MARTKKLIVQQRQALKTEKGAPIAAMTESESDIVVIPGFNAETITFTASMPAVVFTDCKGDQVVVRLSKAGVTQWQNQTRG